MKRFVPGLLVGLILGVGATLVLRRGAADDFADDDADEGAETTATTATVQATVTLTPEQLAAAGLAIAAPEATQLRAEAEAFARVVDPSSLLTGDGDLARDRGATEVARREVARLTQLQAADQNVATRDVELAQAELQRLELTVTADRDRLRLEWGEALANDDARATLIAGIRAGRTALVRVDAAPGASVEAMPAEIRLWSTEAADDGVAAPVLGRVARVDAQLQSPGWWVAQPAPTSAPGTFLRARILASAADQAAWWVPAAAVVRHEGLTWAFVVVDDHTFARRRVEVGPSRGGRVAITAGLAAGESVVTVGAQQLLSAGLSTTEAED